MRLIIILLLSGIGVCSKGQQTLEIKVTAAENKSPISASILIKGTTIGYITDTLGMTSISFAANGSYTLITSAPGYEENETKINIPNSSAKMEIELENAEDMEEI